MKFPPMSLTLDGVPIPYSKIRCSAIPSDVLNAPTYGLDLSAFRRESFLYRCDTTVPIAGLAEFASMLRAHSVGASPATLVKRVRYGGRKGRSALRRLFACALPIDLSTEGGPRLQGRCVMIDERTLRIRCIGGKP